MRLLLIGGNGFIGPHVAASLERRGHEVAVFHRKKNTTSGRQEIAGDRRRLADYKAELRSLGPDVVIDVILSSGAQARALMNVFRGYTRRVVALSSCDVYRACGVLHGSEPPPLEPLPLTESSALRSTLQTYPPDRIRMLQQVFGWLDDEYDKIPVEREILSDPALPGTVLRLPMVYGPGDPLHRFAPVLTRIDDRRPVLLFEEKHAAWRSPRGFVGNVGEAIAVAAVDERAAGRVFNVGDSECRSELEWAGLIARSAGWTGRFVVLPAARTPTHLRWPGNLDQHWVTDTRRIRAELGYTDILTTDDAIAATIDWERSNRVPKNPQAFDYAAEDEAFKTLSSPDDHPPAAVESAGRTH
jgi:nucleoside-diphosphate-sugar epimerase